MSAGAKRANAKRANAKRSDTNRGDPQHGGKSPAPQKQPLPGRPAGGTNGVEDGVVLSPAELRRRRTRNIDIAVTLGALVILFYVMTLARLGSNVMNRPL